MANENDPTAIVESFKREIASWPADQARIAAEIVAAVVAGDDPAPGAIGELTVAQFRQVNTVIHKIAKALGRE
jgi:hypothetical protein